MGGGLIGNVRFFVLGLAIGLIFNAIATVAATRIGTNISTDGTFSVTGLSTFENASSTLLSVTNGLWIGSGGATSLFGSATSTFGGGVSATYLNLSGTSASSTAANGINLTAGCFSITGTCIGTGTVTMVAGIWPIVSSGGTVPAISFGGLSTSTVAVIGNIPYFSGANTFANIATSSPLATYPLQLSGSGALVGSATTFSLAFSTTTSNLWGGTQTFTNNPILGSLTGLIAGNSGTLYPVASSSIFGFTPISNALTKGYFIVGNDAGTAQATSTISISSAGDITLAKRFILPTGEINYFNTTGTTITIASASDGNTNLVVTAPITTLSGDVYAFDNGGANNGRLRYTGTTTRMFHTAFTISMDGAGSGTNLYVFGIAKNGTVGNCKVIQSIAVSNDIQSTALHCMISLATNDYIELYAGNLTDGDDLIVKTLNLFALGM